MLHRVFCIIDFESIAYLSWLISKRAKSYTCLQKIVVQLVGYILDTFLTRLLEGMGLKCLLVTALKIVAERLETQDGDKSLISD